MGSTPFAIATRPSQNGKVIKSHRHSHQHGECTLLRWVSIKQLRRDIRHAVTVAWRVGHPYILVLDRIAKKPYYIFT